jgi:Integral membrane protein CcmA involved in cell shape determination
MAFKNINVIAEDVKIEGNLDFPSSVQIDGEVVGDIKSGGTLTISKNAKVLSNVKTKDAIIAGYFKGDIKASGHVEITSTGSFIGNLIQDKTLLTIANGGLFKGKNITVEDNEEALLEI